MIGEYRKLEDCVQRIDRQCSPARVAFFGSVLLQERAGPKFSSTFV
jgi:hypothetical protein